MAFGFGFGPQPHHVVTGAANVSPVPVIINGPRLAVMGDSRSALGVVGLAPHPTIAGFGTGFTIATRLQGIHTWLNAALDNKMYVVGNWTLGGAQSAQVCSDEGLARVAARSPDCVIYLGTTNDPIDYTAANGFGPIDLGDPLADPSTLARVGAYPTAPGTGAQGTTLGNLDKMLRYFEALGIPVICFEIPTESASRRQRNADVHKWLTAQAAAGTYSNLIYVNVYDDLLATPGSDDGETATGLWRTDLDESVGVLKADGAAPALHPSPSGARFLGEAMASKSALIAATAALTSQSVLPDGTNDAAFLNTNPGLLVGSGTGVNGNIEFGSTGTVSGVVCEGWQIDNVIPGTSAVAGAIIASGKGQRLTITRTGGSSTTIGRAVRLRGRTVVVTLVEGDMYFLDARVTIPARSAEDVFSVSALLGLFEPGLVDADGNNIQSINAMGFKGSNPQPAPKNGDDIVILSVPIVVTAAMASSATGTVNLTPQIEILIRDNADTATNGTIVVDIHALGLRRMTA